ncbi:FG-GAP-like repeat-containing protein [Rubripirellula lacrimiformis]|nr:FG-GAP-like repeat-containing protein [Rubripirellula lacrimiformis]
MVGSVVVLAVVGCGGGDDDSAYAKLRQRQVQQQIADRNQDSSPAAVLERAQASFSKTNYTETQDLLRPLLIAEPLDLGAVVLFAKCQAALGEKLAAAQLLESVPVSEVEVRCEANWLAAQWLADEGNVEAAEQRFNEILNLQGSVKRVHRQLASLLNQQGRRVEAADHLRALARSGDVTEKELFAMNCYGDAFGNQPPMQGTNPDQWSPGLLTLVRFVRSDGHLDQARRLIETLARRFPDSTAIIAMEGRIYSDLEDDRAIEEWTTRLPEGIEVQPEYWHALGMWLQRRDEHPMAIRCFAEAVARDPTDRFSMIAMSRSLQIQGQAETSQCVAEHFDRLNEMAGIMRIIGRQRGSRSELNRVAAILDELGRPWESVAWREVALRTHGSTDRELQRVQQQRSALVAAEPGPAFMFGDPVTATVCGISLADWPAPTRDKLVRSIRDSASGRDLESPASANPASIPLQDVTDEIGMVFQYDSGTDPTSDQRFLHQLTGGGIGVIDFDLDGRSDLYLTQGGGDAYDPHGSLANEMFRNVDGAAVSVSAMAGVGDQGYGQGVAVADLNQDGFADLVVANIGVNVVLINNGDGTFRRGERESAAFGESWTTSIACGDLDGDRLPEIFEVNYIDDPSVLTAPCTPDEDLCSPSKFRPAADRVYRVGVDGSVVDWDGFESLPDKPSYGFAAVIANFDRKEGNDLFVANDTLQNQYWTSQRDDESGSVQLRENAVLQGCGLGLLGQRQGCMGVAQGDFDRTGTLDLLVTNFWDQAADLFLLDASGFFTNSSVKLGLYEDTRQTVGWGAQSVDFDRNGWLDIAMVNGHLVDHRHRGKPYQMLPQYFAGSSRGFDLLDKDSADRPYWSTSALGRTMAIVDWNGDRRPDLIVNHLDRPAALLQNVTATGNAIRFELVGSTSERDAIGAEVQVRCGDQLWSAWQTGGDGLLCSNESVLDVGLGQADAIDEVTVRWPAGTTETYSGLSVNQQYLLVEGHGIAHVVE